MKCEIETVKKLLTESSIVYLNKDQLLYRFGNNDNFVYFILFGRLMLQVPGGKETLLNVDPRTNLDNADNISNQTTFTLGQVNIGWTVGEEVLFDRHL